jgi:hypothetical protein
MYGLTHRGYWDYPLGPVFGRAGTQTTLTIQPDCHFRVEKIAAIDTGTPPGTATTVENLFVGSRAQRPTLFGSTLVVFFGSGSSGHLSWDVCSPTSAIAMTIKFVQDATFSGALFGSAFSG